MLAGPLLVLLLLLILLLVLFLILVLILLLLGFEADLCRDALTAQRSIAPITGNVPPGVVPCASSL